MWGMFHKRKSEGDIEEELSAHLALEVKQSMDCGMGREESRQYSPLYRNSLGSGYRQSKARLKFG